ncbi:hypothetical protein Cenrod_2142 [Candidatus Symbiobacter mobilis CR]|uniref:Uncharacterized protein n=1 Tax=Candidatus Symbiobacter mobilis CR TaxID=946483 RepID=U5N9Y0_9BURK|nr:hypothetical protein Cenrod_2142 [Candidatus Symbiobacter mobilis CR]
MCVQAAHWRPFLPFFVVHSASYVRLSQAKTASPLHPPALQTLMDYLGLLDTPLAVLALGSRAQGTIPLRPCLLGGDPEPACRPRSRLRTDSSRGCAIALHTAAVLEILMYCPYIPVPALRRHAHCFGSPAY